MKLRFNMITDHMCRDLWPKHGPKVWPAWKVFSFTLIRLRDVVLPSTSYRLWVYFRFGGAVHFDLTFDRRTNV